MAENRPTSPQADTPEAEEGYSLKKVIASKETLGQKGGILQSLQSVAKTKCFGVASGSAILAALLLCTHRWKEGGTRLRSINDGTLGFLLVFQIQWYICRRDEHDQKEAVRRFYQNQMAMQQGKILPDVARSARPASSEEGKDSGSHPDAGEDPAVREALSRVVQYDLPTVTKGSASEVVMR